MEPSRRVSRLRGGGVLRVTEYHLGVQGMILLLRGQRYPVSDDFPRGALS